MKLPTTFEKDSRHINVIVETPAGCAAKYNYDEKHEMFKLKKILPKGLSFPFHFGFIPYTKAEDGDPVDVLILMNEPSWPGCIIECRVLGVIEAEQIQGGATSRNDRMIAAAVASRQYREIKSIFALDLYFVDEIVNFLVSYNRLEQKQFKVIGKQGPQTAVRLIKKQMTNGDNTQTISRK